MVLIVIDPGHGGTTNVGGSDWNHAVGPAGTLEKTITLALCLTLRDSLLVRGHDVVMTRTTDVNLGLQSRARVASLRNADVFISVHCNGWHTPDVQGSETWMHSRHSAASAQLAGALQPQLVAATGLNDRGLKSAGFGVLNPDYHRAKTAACLVEVSFLTNPIEEQRLNDALYRRTIAEHLAVGVDAYLVQRSPMLALAPEAEEETAPVEFNDAPDLATAFPAAPSEAELWQKQSAIAESALEFAISFLGCRMGPRDDQVLDTTARGRLRQIVRAVSSVESRHGTQGANQPTRDPFQCGNGNDAWWKELTGQSGQGSRFRRGPNLSNLWANELAATAEATTGFERKASLGMLRDIKKGHEDTNFTPYHSYFWGIIYLIHRINTTANQPSYACRDLSRQRLIDGAVEYNAGGVPDYRKRIEAALKEIGDIPAPLLVSVEAELGFTGDQLADPIESASRLIRNLVVASGAYDNSSRLRRIDVTFGLHGGLESATVEFAS